MNATDNRVHAWIGLWVLAGLMVAGLNGYMLLALLDAPLAGYSVETRNTDRAFRQYRLLVQAETDKLAGGMDALINRFAPVEPERQPVIAKTVPAPSPAADTHRPRPVVLPALTGIVTCLSEDGSAQWLALMDGAIWSRGDQIRELTVEQIDERGIVLARGDQSWFVKAPDLSYSLAAQR